MGEKKIYGIMADNKKLKQLFLILSVCGIVLFSAAAAFAHQPRMVESNFVEVENPEIFQAFYGELKGEPVYFKIESSKSFNLYIGILAPDITNIDKDVSAEIYIEKHGQKELLALLDGVNAVLEKIDQARAESSDLDIKAVLKSLSFNISGHLLHSLFWKNLAPVNKGGGQPSGELGEAIEKEFGSFEFFQ